ncbi:hypothetical protein [Kangiella sediminilitoris]|uniref:Fibronectin type-III domain-containing protein n=1 Tax=Kangiella sediminilitoris TaxID=1144748 RepID=A0A1B3B7J5_9GAMM|nr:hypothetical protein [Kangiella sediminilitoris]AOE48762.1 hypothetical protein KS2013_30 [Kangiella sediminilitoris]
MKELSKKLLLALSVTISSQGMAAVSQEQLAARQLEASDQDRIYISEQLDNPYSLSNMQEAFSQYNTLNKDSTLSARTILLPTHKYIRINPTDESHLIMMNDLDGDANGSIVLHDYPLDHEIVNEGDYYVNPVSETDLYHPVYTVIPVDYVMPKGLPYVVLDQLYHPTEEEYEVETLALEAAGWENEAGCPDSEIVCSEEEMVAPEEPEGPQILSTADSAEMKIAGWFGSRYRPTGYVMIQNTDTNAMEPLRQAKISIGRGIWWRYTHTDDNGRFVAPKRYRGKVRIRAKWKSNIATIRKSWNEMLGIRVSDHLMTITRSSNGKTKNIYFGDDRLWYKGTVHNGLVKYNDFAAANGINRPISGANVWVWQNGSGSASTPMFYTHRHLSTISSVAGIGQSTAWDVLINQVASFAINLLPGRLQPDMLFTGLKDFNRTSGKVSTDEIEQVVFHESAHYSHSVQAGAWNWAKLVASELSNSIAHGDSYVDGSEPSYTAAKQISLAEGWANFVEAKAMLSVNQRFRNGWSWLSPSTTRSRMNNFDMYTVPMTQTRTEFDSWFMHGIFWDIVDSDYDNYSRLRAGTTGIPISNSFSGYIRDNLLLSQSNELYPIFSLLKSDVYTACDFGQDLVSAHPVEGPKIEELFHSYGYTCIDGGNGVVKPSTPSGFYISSYSNGSNHLDWNASSGADYYQIYRSSGTSSTGTYYYHSTVNAPTTEKSVYVSSSTYFKVRACNQAGCSSFSYPRLAYYQDSSECLDGGLYKTNEPKKGNRETQKIEPVPICPV